MKFTIERRALVKMLEVIGRKAPSKTRRDKEVRLFACGPRVFVEANESTGGVEAMVLEEGTCLINHKVFLQLLKMPPKKENLTFESNERRITFASTTLPISEYSRNVVPPAKFEIFSVTDDWLVRPSSTEIQVQVTSPKKGHLPNAHNASIERSKVLDYLLNPQHPIGGGKAHFFMKCGFTVTNWEQFAKALLAHGQTHEVKSVQESPFGRKYSIEGPLKTPSGQEPLVRSIWQLDKGTVAPKLITAYPLKVR